MALKDIWSPEPRTVTLHHKTVFADTIKLKILRWGDKPGGDHNYHNCPDKRQAEGGLKRPLAGSKDGGRGLEPGMECRKQALEA